MAQLISGTTIAGHSAIHAGNLSAHSIATTSYVTTQINNLINGAPGALDTLNELAAALGNDAGFSTTITNSIASKLSLSGGTMTGNINWGQTDRGLVWSMNTDGAYIKFFNTGDGDTNSRLEYATSDNGDEYHRFLVAGIERMTITANGISATGYNKSNWDTAYGWGNHAGLYSAASHNHDGRYLLLSGGTLTGDLLSTHPYYPGYNNAAVGSQGSYYLYGATGNSGIRTNGNFLANGDIYLGTRGQWLSTYLNQNVRTDSSPSFSSVYVGGSQLTGTQVNGLSNMLGVTTLPYSCDITVGGDPDKFYAVQFWGGDQDVWRRIIIKRGYGETAPWDPIGTGAHHGGLLLDWEGNFGGWGGAEYADRLRVFNESYTNVCADMFIYSHSMSYVFMLRGGGAVYHLFSDQPINGYYQAGSPDILYSSSTLSYDDAWSGTNQYDVYAPTPLALNQVNSTRIDGLRTKKQSLLDGRYAAISHSHTFASLTSKPTTISGYGITDAITTANIGSQSVSYATTSGALTSMNISQFTNNSGYITGYTETDTLASVTGRGNTTTSSMAIGSVSIPNGKLYVNSGSGSDVVALQNTLNTGAYLVFADNVTPTWANAPRLGAISNDMVFKTLDTERFRIASTGASTFTGPSLTINTTSDIVANGDTFRMKGGGGSAEFIWYRNYSGSPSEPGFVINNRAGTTTFSHNVNGGGTSVSGNFSAANFSGASSGTNTGDQTNISGNAATATNVAWTGVTSRPTTLSQFTNDLGNYGGWITGYTETIGTNNTSGVAGAKYQINDTWLRVNSDNRQFQIYGNARSIIYRTDGVTNDHGGGDYPHIFYYGGSTDASRLVIFGTNGDIWMRYAGDWISNLLAAKSNTGHTHDDRYYTETEVNNFFSAATAITGYNKSNWDIAYNKRPTAISFSGTGTKTLTLTQGDGSTLTAAFNDIDTDTNTDGQTLSLSGNTLSISGGNSVTLTSGGISQGTADSLYVNVSGDTMTGPLNIVGSTDGQDLLAVNGFNGRLFTVTDSVLDTIYSVNTIAGLPILEVLANNTVRIGKYGANSITIANSNIAINSDSVDAKFPFYVSDRSTATARYNLTNPGMGFNLADSYAQLQLYGTAGAYIDFTTGANDYQGRIMWTGSAFSITGNISATNFSGSSSGTNTGDQTNISGTASNITAYTINQSVGTGNAPTFTNIYNNGWFRNNNNLEGLYNQANGNHFYSRGAAKWGITGAGGNIHLEFRSNHESTLRGVVYADTSNQIGFLNNGEGWSLRANSSNNVFVHGTDLTINADGAGSSNINMNDGDEGNRIIHCNSNRIGFLTQAGSWGAYCDDSGNWAAANFSGSSSGTNTGDQTNISGYSQLLYFSGSSGKAIMDGLWAGGGAYPGYQFTGGNSRFGFSSTSGVVDVYADGNFYATDSSHLVLHAGNYNSYSPTLTGGNASGTWGINVTGSAGSVAWTNVSSRPTALSQFSNDLGNYGGWALTSHLHDDRYFFNRGFTSPYPGEDANAMTENRAAFTYSNNAPLTGCIAYFPASGYGIQLNGDYQGDSFSMRSRNGDAGTWRPWKRLLTDYNYNSYSPTLTGTGASGTWVINVTGNATTATTAARATRANGNFYIDDNYGNGIVGVYTSTRLQGVFAMGDSYKLPADGTSASNLYGMAWSHPNAGGVAANLNTHGLLVMENGTFLAAISGSIRARDDMRAPAIYDSGSRVAISRGEGRDYVNYSRYVYNNGAYSGTGWIEPSDLGVRYANTAGSAPANGGTATALNSSNYISQRGSNGSWNADFQATPAGTMSYGGDLGANGTNGPGGSWWIQENFRHTNSSNYWGTQVAWGWEDNANRLATRNVTGGNYGSWVYYLNSGNVTSYMDAPNKAGTSYYQVNTWLQMNGTHGIYYPSYNGAHFYVNTTTSYTQFRLDGSRGGYGGIWDSYSSVHGIMYDSAGNGGVYREANGRWYWYHHLGNNCTALATSTTSSSYRAYVGGALYAEGDIVAYSDVRKKTDIVTIDNALHKVINLRGVYYTRIDDPLRGRQTGVIAQEINEVLPEVVTYAADVDHYGVSYGNIVGVLIEAIKEQQTQIEDLKLEIKKLRGE